MDLILKQFSSLNGFVILCIEFYERQEEKGVNFTFSLTLMIECYIFKIAFHIKDVLSQAEDKYLKELASANYGTTQKMEVKQPWCKLCPHPEGMNRDERPASMLTSR